MRFVQIRNINWYSACKEKSRPDFRKEKVWAEVEKDEQ